MTNLVLQVRFRDTVTPLEITSLRFVATTGAALDGGAVPSWLSRPKQVVLDKGFYKLATYLFTELNFLPRQTEEEIRLADSSQRSHCHVPSAAYRRSHFLLPLGYQK